MKKVNYLLLFTVVAIALSSCGGLNKMKRNASDVTYRVTPEVLEVHGDKVAIQLDARYPAKYFHKRAIVTATPVLKYEGGETLFAPKVLQGESVQANNQVITNSTGGSVSHSGSVDFNENMMKSRLYIRATAELRGNSVDFDDYPVADGVIATPKLVMVDPRPIMMRDKFERIIPDSYEASILYIINRFDVRRTELTKEEIKLLSDYIAKAQQEERIRLTGAEISAYASPDGPIDLNERLSQNRKSTAETFMTRELRAKNVENYEALLASRYTPEDWEGFRKLMEESNIQDKEIILRVLAMYTDPVVREREIKNISQVYEVIADRILPQLRRAKLTVNTELIGLSDDELKETWRNNPNSLKLEEILYSATLYDGLNDKLAIYKKAGELYPECARAFNNEGYIHVQLGDLNSAQRAFDKAKGLMDNDVVNNNLGVIALKRGEMEKAEQLFTASTGAGASVNYNLGIIKIMQGDYNAASSYLGNTDEFNTALVKVLRNDLDGANTTINRVEEDFAKKFYLKAVIAAKQDRQDVVFENLRLAFAKDASLKNRAKVDMEFAKYFENTVFTGLVN